jgi:hypothetical protein
MKGEYVSSVRKIEKLEHLPFLLDILNRKHFRAYFHRVKKSCIDLLDLWLKYSKKNLTTLYRDSALCLGIYAA